MVLAWRGVAWHVCPTKGTEFRFYLVIKTCEAHALLTELSLYSQCKRAINNITGNMILILHGYKNTSETQLVAIRKPNLWYFSFSCHLLSFLYEARKLMYFISLTDIMENWEFIFLFSKREQLWQIMEKPRRESSIRFLVAASLT